MCACLSFGVEMNNLASGERYLSVAGCGEDEKACLVLLLFCPDKESFSPREMLQAVKDAERLTRVCMVLLLQLLLLLPGMHVHIFLIHALVLFGIDYSYG